MRFRFFNSNWNMVRACKPGEDPIAFYNEIVSLPLPFGEGVVVKAAGDPAGGTWFKVKQVDFADLELVEVLPGYGQVQRFGRATGLFGIRKTGHSERSVHSQSRMRGVNGSGLTERTWSEPLSRFECKR